MPASETDCGLLGALSVMVRAPVRDPDAAGVNVMLIRQLPRAGTPPTQSSVSEKSPVVVIRAILSVALPLLVRMTSCGALVLLTAWLENVKEEGQNSEAGAVVPIPEKLTKGV